MRGLGLLALALLLGGVVVLLHAASLGQASVAFVLVVPVVVGTGPWGFLGGLMVMAGLMAGFWAYAGRAFRAGASEVPSPDDRPSAPPPERRSSAGGFILLGPIPIAFGSTKGLAWTMLLLAVAALALVVLLPLLLRGPA